MVTHTIVNATKNGTRSSSSESLDELDPIQLDDPIVTVSDITIKQNESCPNLLLGLDTESQKTDQIPSTLMNLKDLESTSTIDLSNSPLGKRPKKRKRRRCDSEGETQVHSWKMNRDCSQICQIDDFMSKSLMMFLFLSRRVMGRPKMLTTRRCLQRTSWSHRKQQIAFVAPEGPWLQRPNG